MLVSWAEGLGSVLVKQFHFFILMRQKCVERWTMTSFTSFLLNKWNRFQCLNKITFYSCSSSQNLKYIQGLIRKFPFPQVKLRGKEGNLFQSVVGGTQSELWWWSVAICSMPGHSWHSVRQPFLVSQWVQINGQAEQAGSCGHPPPPTDRIIPPLCRPRYHHSCNKTAFHSQTPGGGSHRPNNTAAQSRGRIQPSTSRVTSSSLSLLSCCSWACHLKTSTQKRLHLTAETIRRWLQHKVRGGRGSELLARSRTPGSVFVVSFPEVRGHGSGDGGWSGAGSAGTLSQPSSVPPLLRVLKSDPVTVSSARFVVTSSHDGVASHYTGGRSLRPTLPLFLQLKVKTLTLMLLQVNMWSKFYMNSSSSFLPALQSATKPSDCTLQLVHTRLEDLSAP